MNKLLDGDLGRWLKQNVLDNDGVREPEYIKELPPEYLENLDIPNLYRIIHAHLDKRSLTDRVKGNIDFKKALIWGWISATLKAHLLKNRSHREINRSIMGSEAGFIRKLQTLGVRVNVESELSREQLAARPHLLMSTHQGGGLETYVLAELLRRGGVKDFRYVMKDELADLPIVGTTIASRKPIWVHRSELKKRRGKQTE